MKTRSRIAIAIALVVALAAAVPAIAATFTTGKYKGTTGQKNPRHQFRKITFHADSTASEITNLKFVNTGTCSDGGASSGDQGPINMIVAADGSFKFDGSSASGATKLHLVGTIAGTKASGSFKVTSRFKKDGTPSPTGSVRCSSGTVKWSAKRIGP